MYESALACAGRSDDAHVLAGSYFDVVQMPGALPVAGSAIVLLIAAMVASLVPANRAARVDVVQALRAE